MPPRHPFFIGKNQVTYQHTIFLLLHALCVFLGASLLSLSVFFCFVCYNKWLDPNKFLLEKMHSAFYLPRTLYFLLLSFNECSFFLELRLAFFLSLILVQILLYLYIKMYLDHWSMLVFIKRVVLKRFEWC
jgi:hypothetical protein